MNPWAPSSTADGGDDYGASYTAPYRASLGGVKAFATRNRLHEASGLCTDANAYSSVQLTDKIDRLMSLKTTALQRVRELEQVEALVSTGSLLLSRQLEAKIETIRSLRGDLEELLAMKSVLLRTLQKNVASEYLDLEIQQQRTFIDLFLKLSDELPRCASSAVATPGSSAFQSNVSSASHINMNRELRQRHIDYEAAVAQCKATIAKFHLIRDDTARVRAAYSQLYQSTVHCAEVPAFAE